MVSISKTLHFVSHHGIYTAIILVFLFCFVAIRKKNPKWMILILPLALANGFGSQFLNAWFLNKFGTESMAIITADITTSSMLNYEYIHKYEAIVKKQDGKYISTRFSTTTAAICPISNLIRIPQSGKSFPVKYIPGYEKNIVILYEQSEEGQALRRSEKQAPVIAARLKYEADKKNKEFKEEYVAALENYLKFYNDKNYMNELYKLRKEF